MQAIPCESFIRAVRINAAPTLLAVYYQPFRESSIVRWFADWEYDPISECYVDQTESRNLTWFSGKDQFINGQRFAYPVSLNEFIRNCQRMNIALVWQPAMADQLWASIANPWAGWQ